MTKSNPKIIVHSRERSISARTLAHDPFPCFLASEPENTFQSRGSDVFAKRMLPEWHFEFRFSLRESEFNKETRKNSKTGYERRYRNDNSLFALRQDLCNKRTFLLRLVSLYSLKRQYDISCKIIKISEAFLKESQRRSLGRIYRTQSRS